MPRPLIAWGHSLNPVSPAARAEPAASPFDRAHLAALACAEARHRLVPPLARAARALLQRKGWHEFGYARLADHARERFGRTARWVRDLAALGDACARLPALEPALTGEDGGRPLGRVAALLIGRAATEASLAEWIALARQLSFRRLRERIRLAKCPPDGRESCLAVDPDQLEEDARLRLRPPVPVRAAFEESVDLFRAVEGREAGASSFLEAFTAEGCSGPAPPDAESIEWTEGVLAGEVERTTRREDALAEETEGWRRLPARAGREEVVRTLSRLGDLSARAGQGGPRELDAQIRALVRLEDEIERRLGRLLADLDQMRAWPRLRFASLGHYAEERLGMSRTTAENRAGLARRLRALPEVRRAYEEGALGLEATLVLVRLLERTGADAKVQAAWVRRARQATVKRLKDEERLWRRCGAGVATGTSSAGGMSPPWPADDRTWDASLRRGPGTARERVFALGRLAASGVCLEETNLFLRAPVSVAATFLAAVEARRRYTQERARLFSIRLSPDADLIRPSLDAARAFVRLDVPVPAWVGLLAGLEEFVLVWDAPARGRRRPTDAVFERDGWRCRAPGCTSRRHLEDHHVVYRSRGGTNALDNRVCLCRFHHQRGEHRGLIRCRGRAPTRLLWRLGSDGIGGVFRNERRISAAHPESGSELFVFR